MTVEISSFSFRDGYPKNASGHGGGFVFDCRLLYNPGLMDNLMDYHGKQKPIIDYLDAQPDVQEFAEHVFGIVDLTIKNYMARDFDHLSVDFGCTGGKHRSVYMAERLAKHLEEKFPRIEIKLKHSKDW